MLISRRSFSPGRCSLSRNCSVTIPPRARTCCVCVRCSPGQQHAPALPLSPARPTTRMTGVHVHAACDHSCCHAPELQVRSEIHAQPCYDWRTWWLKKPQPTASAFQDRPMTSYSTTNWTCHIFRMRRVQVIFELTPSEGQRRLHPWLALAKPV